LEWVESADEGSLLVDGALVVFVEGAFLGFWVFLHFVDVEVFALDFFCEGIDDLVGVLGDAVCIFLSEQNVTVFCLCVPAADAAVITGECDVLWVG
jgi:hypothetical protein